MLEIHRDTRWEEGGRGGSHDLKWSNSTGVSQVGFLSPRIWQGWKIFFFLLLESSAVFDGFIFFLLIWILYNRDAYTRETEITSKDRKFIAVHALNHSGSASSYAAPLKKPLHMQVVFSLTEAKWDWEAESCQERALVKPAASQIPGRWNPRTGVGGDGCRNVLCSKYSYKDNCAAALFVSFPFFCFVFLFYYLLYFVTNIF